MLIFGGHGSGQGANDQHTLRINVTNNLNSNNDNDRLTAFDPGQPG